MEADGAEEQQQQQHSPEEGGAPKAKLVPSKLSKKKLTKLQNVAAKSGIIYISRIPPHLVRNACHRP